MLGLGNILTKGGALLGFPNKYSFNFDGSNDYLNCGVVNTDIWKSSFTISFWVKPSDGQPSAGLQVMGVDDATGDDSRIFISHTTAGKFYLRYEAEGTIKDLTMNSAIYDDGQVGWKHLTFVIDVNNDNGYIYVNGGVIASNGNGLYSGVDTSGTSIENDFYIGAENRSGSSYFKGLIDEVAVWSVALSADDVAKIASKPLDLSKASTYATDRTANLKLWLRSGDAVLPEEDKSIARSDFFCDFDGSDDYVNLGNSSDFPDDPDGEEFTITAWVNCSVGSDGTIFSKADTSNRAIQLFTNADDTLSGYVGGTQLDSSTVVADGTWHHVVLRSFNDGGTYKGEIYIDGVFKVVGTSGTTTATDRDFLIGARRASSNTDSAYLLTDSSVSNLSIYKTALDAQTIKQFAKSRFSPIRENNRFSVVDFDGTDDGIDCGQIDVSGQSITLSAWVFRDGTTDDTIAGRWSSNGAMLYCSGSSVVWYINGNSSSTSIPDKTWVHIVGTFDGVNRKVYKDGVLGDTDADTGTIVNPSQNFEIGRAEFSSGKEFNGSISSVSLYNTAKSAEEVYALYSKGITYNESSESGLVGLWRMGDDTSKAFATIADSSSNSNDGTMTSMASDDIVQQMVAGYDMGAFESTGEETLELVTNGDMSSAPTISGVGLTYYNASGALQSDAIGGVSNTYKIIKGATDDACNARIIPNDSLLVGELLSISVKIYNPSGGFTSVEVRGITTGGGGISYGGSTTTKDTWTTYTGTMTYDGTNAHPINVVGNGGSENDVFYVDDWSVKKVLQSADASDTFPIITDVNEPVLGAELITKSVTDSWTGNGLTVNETSTEQAFSGTQSLKFVTGSGGGHKGVTSNSFTSVLNALYKINFYVYTTDSDIEIRVYQGDGSGTSLNESISVASNQWVNVVKYYNEDGGGSFSSIAFGNNTTGVTTYIDNISLKQVFGNVGTMTQMLSSNLVYSSVLPDQSFLTGVNSAYNFLDFDGTDASVDIGSSINNAFTGSSTISLWMETDLGTGTQQTFIGAYNSDVTDLLHFYKESSGKITAMYEANNIRGTATTDDVICVSGQNDWKHIVCTINDTTNQINIYVNGNLQTLDSIYPGDLSNVTNSNFDLDVSLTIGARNENGTPARFFNGSINQFAIWNKSLSSTEISAIYTAGRHTNLLDNYSDNLKAYYAFGASDAITGLADTDSTIYDRSGNSNHGTPSGTATGDLKSPPNAEPNGYAKGDTNRSTTIP